MGSAPIAHSAAKTDEPVSEGMVSLLEPFIDTIIICTLTGLVILSSGVWTEKFKNSFQTFDMEFISGVYDEGNYEHQEKLFDYLNFGSRQKEVVPYNGKISIVNGISATDNYTLIHNRSIAETVIYTINAVPYTGEALIVDGKLDNSLLEVSGYSLVHSTVLTIHGFSRGAFGEYGRYIVTIGLLLFAFSSAIAWSYYGDRAVTYLFGVGWIIPYRCIYVASFFVAAIADTTLIWLLSAITTVLMTIPNLVGILLLKAEVKESLENYRKNFKQ